MVRLFGLVFFCSACDAESLKILNWNIDSGGRMERIAAVIEGERPDICLFQEVDRNTRRAGHLDVSSELAKRFQMNHVFGKEFQELGQGADALAGQAVLSRLPFKATRQIDFENQSTFWGPHSFLPNWPIMQRRMGGRMALVVELAFGGRTLVVYNTHLESRGDVPLRIRQIDEILADAKRYPAGTPIVIAGDLNTKTIPSPIIEHLEDAGFRDAVNQGKPTRTSMWWVSLDWIFVRGPLRADEGKVDHRAKGSDHYPITVRITAE